MCPPSCRHPRRNGKVYKCPSGSFHCSGTGPCHTHNPDPVYPGWERYTCTDNTHFANGRWSKKCAPGTQCWAVTDGNSPCLAKKHTGTCPDGNMRCIDSKRYCQKGVIYTCPGTYKCAGSAPCVKKM